MKFSKILMLAAVFALTACGGNKGSEVDEAKAKEVAKQISAETAAVKTLEFTMDMTTTDKDKNTDTSKYVYKLTENGDVFASASGSSSEGSSSSEFYRVKNDEYEEVIYYHTVSNTKDSGKDESTVCYGKKGNEITYTTISASVGSAAVMSVEIVYGAVCDPSVIIESAKQDASMDVKYYSSGDKNLVIEGKFSGTNNSDEKPIKEATATYTYSNGLLAKIEATTTYEDGEKMTQKAEAKYSGVKISLPDGWKDIVNKATITL